MVGPLASCAVKSMLTDSVSGLESWPDYFCPVHQSPLELKGALLCCRQGESFPIVDGIPRFVTSRTYADAFGLQWKRYRLTQLDSYSGTSITEQRLRRCVGEEMWEDISGKNLLECGCGAGRFTEVLLNRGAKVTSIDLSDAVEANQQNFPQHSRHRVAQADILRLPFPPGQYDIVLCLGVIQHTPRPEETVAALARHVKPGGQLVIDHYTYKLSEFTKSSALLRQIFKRLPRERGLQWTEELVRMLLPLHSVVRRSRILQALLSRFSPVLCYYRSYPMLSNEMQYQWSLLDTHDSLTCWYRHFRTRSQMERILASHGMEDVECWYGGNGVEARARRPVAPGLRS